MGRREPLPREVDVDAIAHWRSPGRPGLDHGQGVPGHGRVRPGVGRKSRLKGRASRGDRGAEAALRLGEDPKGFSPTVQAGITLLGALAGVYGGATLEPELGRAIGQNGSLAPYRAAIGIGVVALGITAVDARSGRVRAEAYGSPLAGIDRRTGGPADPCPGDA